MITAIDSNILFDIFSQDKTFIDSSQDALNVCLEQGSVIACGIVVVETLSFFSSPQDFFQKLAILRIQTTTISMPAFIEAASVWQEYRLGGGSRTRVMADFLIGAHALLECDRLLTRDRGFYRQYFKNLRVIEPNNSARKHSFERRK